MRDVVSLLVVVAMFAMALTGCGLFKPQSREALDSDRAQEAGGAPDGAMVPSPTAVAEPTPVAPVYLNDGLRMPDMLGLPSESDLRRTPVEASESGGVSARPPVNAGDVKEN